MSFLISFGSFCQNELISSIKKNAKEGNLKQVEKRIDSLLKLTKHQNIKGELLLEKTKILRITGKNTEFSNYLEATFKAAKNDKNKILEAYALYQKYLYLNNKGAESLPVLANYISIANETKDDKLLFSVYLRLSAIAVTSSNAKKAKLSLKKAEKYYAKWQKTDSIYPNINLLSARIYDLEEKYDSVFIVLKKTLSQYKYHKRNRALAQLYYLLGNNELSRKNYDASYKFLNKAHKQASILKNKRFQEISYTNMFRLLTNSYNDKNDELTAKLLRFFNANSLEEATINFEKNYKNLTRLSPKQMALNNLSIAFEKLNNLEKAISYKNKWSNFSVKRVEKEQLNVANFIGLELAISKLNKEKETLEIENELNFTHKVILVLSLLIITILSLFIWSQQRLKIKNEKLAKLSLEKNLLIATKERIELEKTIKQKELELNSFIRDMIEKNSQIEILLKQLKKSNSVHKDKLTEELKSKKTFASKNWIEFMFKFSQLHPDFSEKLKESIPNISPTETKLSVLAFLNLSSKEIGNILAISATSVNQGKYRLKKKIDLAKELSLTDFLQKL